jgi:hypothetical protein
MLPGVETLLHHRFRALSRTGQGMRTVLLTFSLFVYMLQAMMTTAMNDDLSRRAGLQGVVLPALEKHWLVLVYTSRGFQLPNCLFVSLFCGGVVGLSSTFSAITLGHLVRCICTLVGLLGQEHTYPCI